MNATNGFKEKPLFDVEAGYDPFLKEYELARDMLRTTEWRLGLQEMERLAHAGSILSILHVADCMRWGWGYDQDLEGAEAWYKVAIESGSARGFYGLGLTYLSMGRFNEAVQNLETAATRKFSPAYNALACLYFNGEGVPVDRKRARELWRKGGALGHLPSKANLLQQSLHGRYGFWGRVGANLNKYPLALKMAYLKVTNPYTDRLR